jgi:hypothetical protein
MSLGIGKWNVVWNCKHIQRQKSVQKKNKHIEVIGIWGTFDHIIFNNEFNRALNILIDHPHRRLP